MYKNNEKGRSMVEMLGVLAIVGILSMVGIVGYSKATAKHRVNKTVDDVVTVLQNYSGIETFSKSSVAGVDIKGADAVLDAASLGLGADCKVVESGVENGYKVCSVPIGEMYIKYTTDRYHTIRSFMIFVSISSKDSGICSLFLSSNWDQVLPNDMLNRGMIWLKSSQKEAVVLPEGGTLNPSAAAETCRDVCSNGVEFCTVVFDFANR